MKRMWGIRPISNCTFGSADTIGGRLRKKSFVAFGVGLKLKSSSFQILTRQRRLSEPTDVTETLYSVAVNLLNEVEHPGPFRLVGMFAYDFVGIEDRVQLDLFGTHGRRRQLEVALDSLAERFGPNVVHRANDLAQLPGVIGSNLDFLDDPQS